MNIFILKKLLLLKKVVLQDAEKRYQDTSLRIWKHWIKNHIDPISPAGKISDVPEINLSEKEKQPVLSNKSISSIEGDHLCCVEREKQSNIEIQSTSATDSLSLNLSAFESKNPSLTGTVSESAVETLSSSDNLSMVSLFL